MLLKLFRKSPEVRPRFQQDSKLAEELIRRVNAIEFQPSRGFLKDQWQQKRTPNAELDFTLNPPRNGDLSRGGVTQTWH